MTRFLTYKLVLFIPGDKQTKLKTQKNCANIPSAAWFTKKLERGAVFFWDWEQFPLLLGQRSV